MYQKNGVPYGMADLKRDNTNVGFFKNALDDEDIRADYGIIKIPKSELPPTNVQSVAPNTPDGFRAVEGTPELVGDEWRQTWDYVELTWMEKRVEAYRTFDYQLEFITENGLEAWQAKVAEIKALYPKS